MPSLVNQVEMALISIYRPGIQKSTLTPAQRERLIIGGRTMEVYLEHGCRWARWAREELGVRRLVEARLAGQPWVQELIDGGRSAWTIAAAISALRKLEKGIATRWGRPVVLIAPEHLAGRPRRLLRLRRRRGAYPPEDLALLLAHLDPGHRTVAEACVALGLRRREVISVQAGDVALAAVTYSVKGLGGDWTDRPMPEGYRGVIRVRRGKGGRPREIPVPLEYRGALEEMLRHSHAPTDRLWPVQALELGEAVTAACRRAGIPSRGVHGLRHTWAKARMRHLQDMGATEEGARQVVSWWLGHNRLAVTSSYVPKRRLKEDSV